MDTSSRTVGSVTPVKDPYSNRSKISEGSKKTENSNPNVTSPGLKISNSPAVKSAKKAQKSATKKPVSSTKVVVSPSPKKKIRERKFVIAKKKSSSSAAVVCCKCRENGKSKCLCVAYESLRASQEEFFKNRSEFNDEIEFEKLNECGEVDGENNAEFTGLDAEAAKALEAKAENDEFSVMDGSNRDSLENVEANGEIRMKRRRDRLLEVARQSVPESGSGRVMHLVKAFENLLTIPKSSDSDENERKETEETKKGMKWALPGFQQPPKVPETQVSSSSFCPSDFFITSESLGSDSKRSFSLGSSHGSIPGRTSACGRRSRRNSAESSGTYGRRERRKRQDKATSQKPFMLRTEQRGKYKEEEFTKKVQQMMEEEEKMRIPIAQGLPWTTDEPECLVKPLVKENTAPIYLVLHSDIRAVERAEFDHQVAEKMCLIEQYRMERERQQKLAEEEEIKRLRKELVPKAQPMPYFDRPFIPRRSMKQPTIPKEPKFRIPQNKKIKCVSSCNE